MNDDRPEQAGGGGRDRGRSRLLGRAQKLVGIVLVLAAIAAFAQLRGGRVDSIGPVLGFAAFALVGGAIGARIYVRGKQRSSPSASEKLASDPRPPVLYLRAFDDDEVTRRRYAGTAYPLPIAFNSEEEQLAKTFEPVGPMIGIGRPGSPLPDAGAAREWTTDEEWQARVVARMDEARLVILRLAESDGVWWELARAADRLRPEQLVLLVPFGEDEYRRIAPRLEEVLGRRLPEFEETGYAGSLRGLIYFERDGTGRFLPIRSSFMRTSALNPVTSALRLSIEPLFRELGVEWERPAPAPLRVWVTILAGATVLGIIITLIALALGMDL